MYEHLFFDLDHTLWDFETNSRQALTKIYYDFELRQFGVLSPDHFIDTYLPINYVLWREFREGNIDAPTVKIKRFQDTMKLFGVTDHELIKAIKSFYLEELPLGGALMPNALQALEALQYDFQLHIITNGFLEVTKNKMAYSNLTRYFKTILSAEEVGVLKPNPIIFQTAFERSGATAENSLFIGDNIIADVQGARKVGMHQVYYNPERVSHKENPTYEIADFTELVDILIKVKQSHEA